MSFPLPNVLVLLNLPRCPAVPPSGSVRRLAVPSSFRQLSIAPLPACLSRVLLSSARPLSSRLSTRWAGRFGDERRLLAIAMAMLMSSDAMRRSFGCVFLGSLTPRLSIAPYYDTDGGEGSWCRRCLLLSDFSCDARILWIAFVAVAMAASP